MKKTNKEIWKDIIGFEGIYQFSNLYKVKRLFNRYGNISNRILKIHINNKYPFVNLSKIGKHKLIRVHRLVLEYFVGLCPPGMEACHNDGNSKNYLIENLRWDFHKNNENDKIKHGTFKLPLLQENQKGSKNNNAKLNDWKLRAIRRLLEDDYLTQREIAEIFKISQSEISNIKLNKTWKGIDNEKI